MRHTAGEQGGYHGFSNRIGLHGRWYRWIGVVGLGDSVFGKEWHQAFGLIPLDRLYEIERFEAGDPQRLSIDGLREKYGDAAESHMREFVDDRTSSRSWKALIAAIVGIVVSALLFVGVSVAYSFDSSDSSDRNGPDSSYSSDSDDDSDSSYSDSDDDSDYLDYDSDDYE